MEHNVIKIKERTQPTSNGMTKVLMISTDTKILESDSPVRVRMREYGSLFHELHIVLFCLKRKDVPSRIQISDNTHVYPTHSVSKLLYVKDAEKIGCQIIHDAKLLDADSVITTQDPFETGHVGRGLSKRSRIPLHVQIHTDFYSILYGIKTNSQILCGYGSIRIFFR